MSRQIFRRWGATLLEGEFAKALAAVALFGPLEPPVTRDVLRLAPRVFRDRSGDILVPIALANVARLVAAQRDSDAPLAVPADGYARSWDVLGPARIEASGAASPLLRLEVAPEVPPDLREFAPDLFWFVRTLQSAWEVASAVYVRADDPDRPVAWEWPLRVGVLGDPRSRDLAAQIAACHWPDLCKLVPLAERDEACDLFLLPYDLSGALARVLDFPRRLRADCVLAMQGAGVAAERALPLMTAIRSAVLTSGVGVVAVDPDRGDEWFNALIEELSHNLPLDVALVRANRAGGTGEPRDPPILIGSRRLAENSRITAFARRYGQELRRTAAARAAPPPSGVEATGGPSPTAASRPPAPSIEGAADDILGRAERGEWQRESGDARDLARARRDVEDRLGGGVPLARDGEAPSADPRAPRDERRVSFTVTDVSTAESAVRTDRLAANRTYELLVFIGLPRPEVESADVTFPSDELPASPSGHWLDVFFVPLSRDEAGRIEAAQHGRVLLPPDGDSTSCLFTFRTHGVTAAYRARLIVCHETRVIQTILLTAPLDGSGRALARAVENVVAPGFGDPGRRRFDAAIVVNHGADGQAGITTIVGQEASFREPVGMDRSIDAIKKLIGSDTGLTEARGALEDPALTRLLWDLADKGRELWKVLPEQVRGLAGAARIQVVETRRGAWLPVEFLYDQRLPDADAALCPNARAALLGEAQHRECPHRDDRRHQCPLRFWGFERVIEHQPPQSVPPGADYVITVPTAEAHSLNALDRALVAASKKVRQRDLVEPGGILESVKSATGAAATAKDWGEWERAVQAASPTLLVLLPHSQDAPGSAGSPALEIGGEFLRFSQLEPEYVTGPRGGTPMVLLLGCSTQLADVPFLSFVQEFKANKAALIVGTLATIRGRRAVEFVSSLLGALKAASGRERTFGEVFLDIKRKLLANGDGFVLSLTAYGDVDWRL